eukprot:13204085-Alexandrium_andersonii.AAC.1
MAAAVAPQIGAQQLSAPREGAPRDRLGLSLAQRKGPLSEALPDQLRAPSSAPQSVRHLGDRHELL